MKIDKSVFTPEELEQYEALIAKAKVDPEENEKEMEKEKLPFFPGKGKTPTKEREEEKKQEGQAMDKSRCEKSADPALAAAMERLEKLEKSLAMEKFIEIAKKYAPLGENEVELAKTLYQMQQANEENYNAYLNILDKSLGLVEKSGLFTEIGKSASGGMGGDILSQIENAAGEIMKSDSAMTREQAIAKAWENHPELIAEYDAEYRKA